MAKSIVSIVAIVVLGQQLVHSVRTQGEPLISSDAENGDQSIQKRETPRREPALAGKGNSRGNTDKSDEMREGNVNARNGNGRNSQDGNGNYKNGNGRNSHEGNGNNREGNGRNNHDENGNGRNGNDRNNHNGNGYGRNSHDGNGNNEDGNDRNGHHGNGNDRNGRDWHDNDRNGRDRNDNHKNGNDRGDKNKKDREDDHHRHNGNNDGPPRGHSTGDPCTTARNGQRGHARGSNHLACKQHCRVLGCSNGTCGGSVLAFCECQKCPPVKPTVPPPAQTCIVSGDPHITSFSGLYFTPVTPLNNEYLLLQPAGTKFRGGKSDHWSVHMTPFACAGNSIITCLGSVVIRIRRIKIELKRPLGVYINGKNATTPWYYPDNVRPFVTVIMNYGAITVVTSEKLSMIYQVGHLQMQVPKNDKSYEGYCITKTYTEPLPAAGAAKVNMCPSSTPEEAARQCAPLKNVTGPFAGCVEIEGAAAKGRYDNCVFDICVMGIGAKCDMMEEFVSFCMKAHPDLVIDWRDFDLCPPECPAGRTYYKCASNCPNSCADPTASDHCKSLECEGACVCNKGTLLENGKCVSSSDCGCLDKTGYHTQTETWKDITCTQTCKCKGTTAQCVKDPGATPCPNLIN